MRRRFRNLIVGADEPRKPTHSLPSYNEPTPETHRRLTREEEAELALLHTTFEPAARGIIIALFVVTIAAVPIVQFVAETRHYGTTRRLPMFDAFKLVPGWAKLASVHRVSDLWHLLPLAAEIKANEKTLERDSIVSQALLPHVQTILTAMGAGNEQVYPGRDGWLFYRPDVEYVTAAPFLDASSMHARRVAADVQPDSIHAITNFRDQLAARGIELMVMPVPVKSTIDGEKLARFDGKAQALQNASFDNWKRQLSAAGVRVFDPTPQLVQRKAAANGAPLYLATDSHWRPETMEFVADNLARSLNLPAKGDVHATVKPIAGVGDIAAMLKLPADQKLFAPEQVTIDEVTQNNEPWHPSRDADVLLLGDSFTNIYSLDGMGWGESAGFAEQLSRALGGRALDVIARNSDGAFATREILQRDLARGHDRLAGKKLVIWEFAARELAIGNWKLLEMKLGMPPPAKFLALAPGEQREITGVIEAVSRVPRPASVPYKDHVMSLHIVDVNGEPGAEALVYAWSMRENAWTSAARLRAGDHVTLRARAWSDVSAKIEKFNRSEIDDPAVQVEEPIWAESIR